MYFQLEVDYYSNEANKNKYKNVQLIASTKNNLKIATDCTGHCTCNDNLSYLLLGLQNTFLLGLGVTSKYIYRNWKNIVAWKLFVSARYKSHYSNTIYVNKNQHSLVTLSPSSSFMIHKCGVITLACAHCSQPLNKQTLYKS